MICEKHKAVLFVLIFSCLAIGVPTLLLCKDKAIPARNSRPLTASSWHNQWRRTLPGRVVMAEVDRQADLVPRRCLMI